MTGWSWRPTSTRCARSAWGRSTPPASSRPTTGRSAPRATTTVASVWELIGEAEVAPGSVARLVIRLPEKYPGQDLVFLAKVLSARGSLVLSRDGKWPIHLSVDGGRTWSYHAEDALARTRLALRFALGMR